MYVFDVDGCLADTLPMVRWAYIAAGVEPTEDDVRHPWRTWLPDLAGGLEKAGQVRARKTELYAAMLMQRPPRRLPAGGLARELLDAGEEVYAVTAAHSKVVPIVLAVIGLTDIPILGSEVPPEHRALRLNELSHFGIYYDDDLWTCSSVRTSTSWTVIRV